MPPTRRYDYRGRCTAMLKLAFATWALLAMVSRFAAQAPQRLPKGMVKTENGYLHKPSRLEFIIPKEWEVRPEEVTQMYPALVLRRRLSDQESVEVTLLFTPLVELTLKDVLEQELKVLRLTYQDKNVLEPVEITIPTEPPRPGYRIMLEEGPDFKGRQQGAVYLFTTSDEKSTWQVRLRATWNKTVAKSAYRETENLLQQFRLHKPD